MYLFTCFITFIRLGCLPILSTCSLSCSVSTPGGARISLLAWTSDWASEKCHQIRSLMKALTCYILTSVCIISMLFSIYFLRCWQGEFVLSIKSLFGWWSFPCFRYDSGVILKGEIRCHSLWGVKGVSTVFHTIMGLVRGNIFFTVIEQTETTHTEVIPEYRTKSILAYKVNIISHNLKVQIYK